MKDAKDEIFVYYLMTKRVKSPKKYILLEREIYEQFKSKN